MENSRLVVNAHDYPIIVQFTDGVKNHGHYIPARGRVFIHNSLDITPEHAVKFPRLFDNKPKSNIVTENPVIQPTPVATPDATVATEPATDTAPESTN